MTLKFRGMSVKQSRKLLRVPAAKRLSCYLRANWLKRYREKRTC